MRFGPSFLAGRNRESWPGLGFPGGLALETEQTEQTQLNNTLTAAFALFFPSLLCLRSTLSSDSKRKHHPTAVSRNPFGVKTMKSGHHNFEN